MSARIYFRQDGVIYKFLRIEQSDDGSVYVSVLREHEQRHGAMKWNQARQQFVPDPARREGQRRVSYHTSGRVNYHALVESPPRFFDPLFDVTQRNLFLLISIPSISKLPSLPEEPEAEAEVPHAIIDAVGSTEGRVTCALLVAPADDQGRDGDLAGVWNLCLGYDTFSLFVAQAFVPFAIPDGMDQHFIYAAPSRGRRERQFCGRLEAELAYHQKRTGGMELIIYGPDELGVYTLYPSVVMRIIPRLAIEFAEPNLTAEVVEGSRPNRVRFRIRGRGGFIKNRDLRPLVRNVELDAEL